MSGDDVRQRHVVDAPPPAAARSDPVTSGRHWEDEDVAPDAGWMVFLKVTLFTVTALPVLLIVLMAIAIKSPIDAKEYTLPSPPILEGPLAINKDLVSAERLYEGKLKGPESILVVQGHIYTGTADGKILHIHEGQINTITTLGNPPCGTFDDEPTCGRPLGMRFDKDGYLIVADAYLGLFRVNVATGDKFQLLPYGLNIKGKTLHFLNDLDIDSNGIIYVTDTSKYQRREFPLDMLEGTPSGRLLRYDEETNDTEVLMDGLHFANGVQISRNGEYLLVTETMRARIWKYHLKGPMVGKSEIFAENLPGTVDNIRLSSGGGFWVAIGICRHSNKFSLVDALQSWPRFRTQLAKIPLPYLHKLARPCSIILELDQQGNIIRSLQDLAGETIAFPSEVEDDAGTLYIGSFVSPYIGRIHTFKPPAAA